MTGGLLAYGAAGRLAGSCSHALRSSVHRLADSGVRPPYSPYILLVVICCNPKGRNGARAEPDCPHFPSPPPQAVQDLDLIEVVPVLERCRLCS